MAPGKYILQYEQLFALFDSGATEASAWDMIECFGGCTLSQGPSLDELQNLGDLAKGRNVTLTKFSDRQQTILTVNNYDDYIVIYRAFEQAGGTPGAIESYDASIKQRMPFCIIPIPPGLSISDFANIGAPFQDNRL